jgi:hypothetical protein
MAITSITPKPATARCDPDGSLTTPFIRRPNQDGLPDPVSDLLDTLVRLLARQAVAEAMAAASNKTDTTPKKHHS